MLRYFSPSTALKCGFSGWLMPPVFMGFEDIKVIILELLLVDRACSAPRTSGRVWSQLSEEDFWVLLFSIFYIFLFLMKYFSRSLLKDNDTKYSNCIA